MGIFWLLCGLIWPCVPLIAIRGPGPAAQRARQWTLLNLFVPIICWIGACLSVKNQIPSAMLIGLLGLGLPVLPILAQWVAGARLYRFDNGILKQRLSRIDFLHQFVSRIGAMISPPGLALGILGTIATMATSWKNPTMLFTGALVLVALLGLWTIMWNSLRELSVPGKIIDFPMEAWRQDLFRLAEKMNAPLKSVFLAQTRSSQIAGAFCFNSGKVGLTDTLLSHLEHQEFLAVMAHELRHLTHAKDSVKLLTTGTICCLAIGLGLAPLQAVLPTPVVLILILSSMGLVAAYFMSRLMKVKQRHEDEADDASVAFVGAQPLMNALVKVHILNGVKKERRMSRYRSLEGRMSRLATLGRLPASSVQETIQRIHREMNADLPTSNPVPTTGTAAPAV